MMKKILFAIAFAPLTACQPSNQNDCRAEAAKMPTNDGLRLANKVCYKKFPN